MRRFNCCASSRRNTDVQLNINGTSQAITLKDADTTVDALLRHLDIPTVRGVAVALNDSVVPRSQWAQTRIQDGDRLEIIQATQGG